MLFGFSRIDHFNVIKKNCDVNLNKYSPHFLSLCNSVPLSLADIEQPQNHLIIENYFRIFSSYIQTGEKMKDNIHPEYKLVNIRCACGNEFQTRSTTGDMNLDICSACHPFFTGKQKLIDTAGRVDKFLKKYKIQK